ncbi:aminotransferase AlaT [Actinobacillus pleuropneumoniae]|nr:aminotransferase AlaT [Actinobacillus pleuropneumoniae]KIE98220.1 aminotransferase AlaT [Actinobacillus pleuropneumoniae]
MVLSGPKNQAKGFIEGLDMLASMRLCATTPMQHAIQTALGGYQSINEFVLPGGRLLEQRNKMYELLVQIPGISCVKAKGALYMFPKIDTEMYGIKDDAKFIYDLLQAERVLLVQGSGFNWHKPDHFRVVTLPYAHQIEEALGVLPTS